MGPHRPCRCGPDFNKNSEQHCCSPGAALPPYLNSIDLATDYVTLSISDMDIYPLYIMTRDTTTIQTMVMLHRSSFINHFEAFK
jgi:hypothetical protein